MGSGMRMSRFKFAILGAVCLAVLMPATGSAQNVRDTLERLYQTNPQLGAERAKLRALDENIPQAWSTMRPNISMSATRGVESVNSDPSSGRRYLGSPASFGLTATQTVFDGLQTYNNVKGAEAKTSSGRALLEDAEQNLMLNAITAHASVVRDREILALRTQAVSVFQLLHEAAQMRYKVGEISITDSSITLGRLELAQAELARAKATLAASEADYKKYVGIAPGPLKPVEPARNFIPQSLGTAVDSAIANNPALQSAKANELEAMHSKHSAFGALAPTVGLEAGLKQENEPVASIDRRETANVNVRLTIPVFDGGLTHSKVRQAQSVEMQRQFEADNVRQLVTAGVAGTWQQTQQADSRVESLRRQVAATEKAFEGVKAEYRAGERSIYEILDSQRDVIEAKVTLADAVKERAVIGYALLATMGKLNSRELALNVQHYDPKIHHGKVRGQWFGLEVPDARTPQARFKSDSLLETGSISKDTKNN